MNHSKLQPTHHITQRASLYPTLSYKIVLDHTKLVHYYITVALYSLIKIIASCDVITITSIINLTLHHLGTTRHTLARGEFCLCYLHSNLL